MVSLSVDESGGLVVPLDDELHTRSVLASKVAACDSVSLVEAVFVCVEDELMGQHQYHIHIQ